MTFGRKLYSTKSASYEGFNFGDAEMLFDKWIEAVDDGAGGLTPKGVIAKEDRCHIYGSLHMLCEHFAGKCVIEPDTWISRGVRIVSL